MNDDMSKRATMRALSAQRKANLTRQKAINRELRKRKRQKRERWRAFFERWSKEEEAGRLYVDENGVVQKRRTNKPKPYIRRWNPILCANGEFLPVSRSRSSAISDTGLYLGCDDAEGSLEAEDDKAPTEDDKAPTVRVTESGLGQLVSHDANSVL